MFSAATIPYDPEEQNFTLQDLLEHLSANLSVECTLTEWRGFDATVPQVRVATSIPLTIQIEDDPEYVPDDLADLVDRAEGLLPREWVDLLRACTAKLEILEADVPVPEPDEEGVVELTAETRLDPSLPEIEAVIVEIARFMDSLAYDNVNDEWLVPEG
jgi:trans-aconitate methyltransferase